jgi:hypothetical protein
MAQLEHYVPSRNAAASTGTSATLACALTSLCVVVLFTVNAYICQELFSAEFIRQMGSTAGAFIAISRWAMRHWHDLTWYPLWFTGMPFFGIYQPGMHLSVAWIATVFQLTPQHAYHLLNALVYCLQPVAFFWLCYRSNGSRGCAFAAGLAYSLISPSAFLTSVVRHEIGGLWFARRYQTVVYYGEGPHNLVLLLIPLAILFLHKSAAERKRWYFPLACLTMAAIILTNWPGTVGLGLALVAYALAQLGGKLTWAALPASFLAAYLVACRWIAPAAILPILENAQQSDGTRFTRIHLFYLLGAAAALSGMHMFFERRGTDRWLRFFFYFAFVSGLVTLVKFWTGVNLLPQGHRFLLEMEMAMLGAMALLGRTIFARWPWSARVTATALFAVLAALQLHNYRQYAHAQTLPVDIQTTPEYRISKWMETHMGGSRVFVPGSVSIWMNAFTDVPQLTGCCDQGVPSFSHRLANYTLYSAENAGDNYVPIALLWLKAYGARAIAVVGPNSQEFFRPYARPEAFRGVLPELWRQGEDVIYQVPTPSRSLAHVLGPEALVSREPANGLDVSALRRYVTALELPTPDPAGFEWMNPHQARVRSQARKGQVVSVQISYNPSWRATVNGLRQPTHADALGLMVIEPACDGECDIDLVFDRAAEIRWTKWLQIVGLVLVFGWPFAERLRVRK